MRKSFFGTLAEIDKVIEAGPKECNYASDLAPYFGNSEVVTYFFGKVQSPEWLTLLRREGMFNNIPSAIASEGSMVFPFWPAGEYLTKVAGLSPDIVSQIALEIPQTDNARAHSNIAQAMSLVPASYAVEWARNEARWVDSQATLYTDLPLRLGELAQWLAANGEPDSALDLARSLLAILDGGRQPKQDEKSSVLNAREPRTRIDPWQYEQILNKNVPVLVNSDGEQTIGLLCDLLDRAILLSDRKGADRRPEDLSRIWRPAIEDHQQNLNLGVKDLLITAIRKSAEQMARKDPTSVRRLAALLETRAGDWNVFYRIALHVLRLFPDAAPKLVRERLLDRALFDSIDVRHEYFLLEKDCFGRLSEADRSTLLDWIAQGPPDVEAARKTWQDFTGQGTTLEWTSTYIRQWKRDRLKPLEEYLSPAWKETYATLVTEGGPSSHPEFTSYVTGGSWGPSSPVSSEDIEKMSVGELVEYLEGWEPPGDRIHAASPEGVGREITTLISKEPDKYADGLGEFERLSEPTYARAIVQGFDGALKNGTEFDWEPVLGFCVWAVTRPRDIPRRTAEPFVRIDPHWGWTRTAILRFLISGFTSESNPIPGNQRESVWQVIEPVTHDEDPTQEDEQKYLQGGVQKEYRKWGGNVTSPDPLTSAINSVRGTAIEATVQYALWLRRSFEKDPERDNLLAQGFDAMPEARKVFEDHLDTTIDPSLSIRSVYGHRLPWLHALAPHWAEAKKSLILSRVQPEYWHAAWDTYVCFCQPYDNVLNFLNDEYAFAIEQIGEHEHPWSTPQAPDLSLAQHLAAFFWRGKLAYGKGLLEAFYQKADAGLRGYMLNYLGRSLCQMKEQLPGELADRLKGLWINRLEAAKQEPKTCAIELKEYGWWFASGKLEDQWSIEQLVEALRMAQQVDPDFMVVERLAQLSEAFPLRAIDALGMIVESDVKGWNIRGWQDKAKHIIRAARKTGNANAREMAEDLVNLIGSRGLFDFGELLKEPIEQSGDENRPD